MKWLIRFLVYLLMPLVLILLGGGIVGIGINREWEWLIWTGFVVAGAGILWGIFIFLVADSGSFLD